ncbi:36621_t:CDS:10, partial [Gigaspora margarita]
WKFLQFEVVPKYGKFVRLGPKLVMISDKDAIKQILTAEFPKSGNYKMLRMNENHQTLFSSIDKTFHKQRRRIISPAFSIKYIASLEKLMLTCIKDLVYNVDEMLKCKGDVLNIVNLIQICAVDIIGETSFGGKFNSIEAGQHPLPEKIWIELRRRLMKSIFPLLKPWLTEDPYLKDLTDNLIKTRREGTNQKTDILHILLNTFDIETEQPKDMKGEQGRNEDKMTDYEVYDQIVEFLIAGTDTVSFTTAMTLVQLSKNPQKLLSLVKELDEVLNIDELPIHDKLKDLKYLNAVISETMRLWPVFLDGGIGRAPDEDTIFGKYMIPKNTNLVLNIYDLHHDPNYWGENVEEFIPERWLEPENIPRDVYYPFSAGIRNCIGQNFAMMELRLLIATLVHRYNLTDVKKQDLDIIQYFTPSFKDLKYDLKLEKRKIK